MKDYVGFQSLQQYERQNYRCYATAYRNDFSSTHIDFTSNKVITDPNIQCDWNDKDG